jgi:hypothetical protein
MPEINGSFFAFFTACNTSRKLAEVLSENGPASNVYSLSVSEKETTSIEFIFTSTESSPENKKDNPIPASINRPTMIPRIIIVLENLLAFFVESDFGT